jgi:3-oxoacyl-[acyl-carrier protein] reductase
MDLGLNGKRALVLGASRGLGAAVARGLAREGTTVIAAARSSDDTRAWIAAEAPDVAARLSAQRLDLADRAAVDALADAVLQDGGVDILVNNSGGPPPGPAAEIGLDLWQAQFAAMAGHLFHLSGRLLPAMRQRRWGRILTIASSGIEQPIPNLALSNSLRMAVLGWSKTLAAEVAADGVTVNLVLPGRIHTDRVDQLDGAAAAKQGKSRDEVAKASQALIPLGRYGRPEEFADAVVFLASDRAGYITGTKLRVDGGLVRGL